MHGHLPAAVAWVPAIEVVPARRFADVATCSVDNHDPGHQHLLMPEPQGGLHDDPHGGRARPRRVRTTACRRRMTAGVLDVPRHGDVCGWAGVGPRADMSVARSTKTVWLTTCRSGRSAASGAYGLPWRGISCTSSRGCRAGAGAGGSRIEAVPVDNRGAKDGRLAFVGTRALFGARLHQGGRHRLRDGRLSPRGDAPPAGVTWAGRYEGSQAPSGTSSQPSLADSSAATTARVSSAGWRRSGGARSPTGKAARDRRAAVRRRPGPADTPSWSGSGVRGCRRWRAVSPGPMTWGCGGEGRAPSAVAAA